MTTRVGAASENLAISAFFDATCDKCGARFGWCGEATDRPPCPRCGATVPASVLAKPIHNPLVDAYINRCRGRYGLDVISTRKMPSVLPVNSM